MGDAEYIATFQQIVMPVSYEVGNMIFVSVLIHFDAVMCSL